jgi:hypothetical protein
MGFIRGAAKAVKVANTVRKAAKANPEGLPGVIGAGAREVITSAAPLGTRKIVDRMVGQKVQDAVTNKAARAGESIQGRMGHFNSASGASSNNSSWDSWDTPAASSTPTSAPAAAPKKDPWAEW